MEDLYAEQHEFIESKLPIWPGRFAQRNHLTDLIFSVENQPKFTERLMFRKKIRTFSEALQLQAFEGL